MCRIFSGRPFVERDFPHALGSQGAYAILPELPLDALDGDFRGSPIIGGYCTISEEPAIAASIGRGNGPEQYMIMPFKAPGAFNSQDILWILDNANDRFIAGRIAANHTHFRIA